MRVNGIQSSLTFGAKDVTLFTDFDGTFFQSSAVNNDYFRAFDDFRHEREDKFKIFITTGRRLEGKSGGFLGTYNSLRSGGYKFPKFDGIITAEGGDLFLFNAAGEVDKTPAVQKRALMKSKTGWDLEVVMTGLRDIAQKLETSFTPVDKGSFHKLAIIVDNPDKNIEFADAAEEFFERSGIAAYSEPHEVQVVNADNTVSRRAGIKMSACFNGHHIHKDFDIFTALESAQRENDFIIVAGNERNDKEMLNLFNYIGERGINSTKKIPKNGLEEMVEKINKLPIGVIFVDGTDASASPRMLELKAFIEAQQKLFPNKVRIIKETKRGEENTFVKALRELTELYFPKSTQTSQTPTSAPTSASKSAGSSLKGKYIALGALVVGAIAAGVYYIKNKSNKKD